ncbi:DUF2997 domain-containing protein [Breznakiella homolactica]|uniref:DUF2997 domain-containing protein n=1 Tax=Breznakiella homolactica TaxID=2798577 RepID=A0A7T7XMI2_9SPIR|nr:DUF2997 domain-containing protein [Breznakiella homolactica]QQO09011.1 DUF2997 domain-containing protein [Breznakiella homolactica]
MAEKQELEIQITHDGTVTINVQGAKGSSCLDLTKDLEESLGVVMDRERKSSFYEQPDTEKVRIQGEKQ